MQSSKTTMVLNTVKWPVFPAQLLTFLWRLPTTFQNSIHFSQSVIGIDSNDRPAIENSYIH